MNKNRIITILFFCTIVGLINQNLSGQPLGNNLVAHYKMNDNATNDIVIDSQGYADGTAQQNTSVLNTTGKINGAFNFNGTTDYIDTGNAFQSVFQSDFSIVAWVKEENVGGTQTIACTDGGDGNGIRFGTDTTWHSAFISYVADSNQIWTETTAFAAGLPPLGTWTMWTIVVKQISPTTISASVYCEDGSQVSRTKTATCVMANYSNNFNLFIGAINYMGSTGDNFQGSLDNVMIFNKALSLDEIAELYNLGNGLEDIPYIISGQVTLLGGSADVTDVNLNLSGDADIDINPEADGNYGFTGRSETGDYMVAPLLEGYYFFPENYSYISLDGNRANQDFTGLHANYDSDGDGIPDWLELIWLDNSGDGESRKRCFIATACYGSHMTSEVNILREFRDEYLLTNPIGEIFVDTYYKTSPQIAGFVGKHPILKKAIRGVLDPVVWISNKIVYKR